MQYNVCGSACNDGDVGSLVDALRDIVVEVDPDVVLLNEICLAQADRLWEELQLRGFPASAAFAATAGVSRCPGEPGHRWYGNAIVSKGAGMGEPQVLPLPNRPRAAEQRSILSMQSALHGHAVWVSATHLVPRRNRELNDRQIAEVLRIQRELAAQGGPVVFGGDFNATPRLLSKAASGGDAFVELDHRASAATFGLRKIDYIFLDKKHFSPIEAAVERRTRLSDHRCLDGKVTLVV